MEFSGKEEGETAKDARGQKLKDPKLEFYILAELIPPSQLLWARLRTVLYHTISDIMIYQRRGGAPWAYLCLFKVWITYM